MGRGIARGESDDGRVHRRLVDREIVFQRRGQITGTKDQKPCSQRCCMRRRRSEPISTVLKWVDRHQAGPAQSILDRSATSSPAEFLAGIATTDPKEQSRIWSTASGVLNAYHSNAAMASTTGAQFDSVGRGARQQEPFISARRRVIKNCLAFGGGFLEEIRTASKKRAWTGRRTSSRGLRLRDSRVRTALDHVATRPCFSLWTRWRTSPLSPTSE